MATGDRLQIADKPTLDNINKNLGETADEGGSTTTGTSMAKLNEDIRLSSATMQEVQNLGVTINGKASPYGTGLLGDVTFNSANFTWPTQDFYNRYIIQVKSLTIPEGQTMKPPAKCDGLYILSQGDVNINGNIDIIGLRKTVGDVKISPTINVGTRTFELAKGGYASLGGANGTAIGYWEDSHNYEKGNESAPIMTPTSSISGNVNGGGVSMYGSNTTPTSVSGHRHADEDNTPYSTAVAGNSVLKLGTATGAIIIITKGTVTINGNIFASATPGKNAGHGTSPRSISSWDSVTGLGGDGAIAPSGGGAVTIICNKIVINGKIDTNGKLFTSPDGTSKASEVYNEYGGGKAYGGSGGKGGTFTSTAGQIKVYEGVDE